MNMKRDVLLLLLILLTAAPSVPARELRLDDAFGLALEHSYRLKKSKADLAASLSGLGAAKAERFPTISITAGGFYLSEVPVLDIQLQPGFSISREVGTADNYQADLRLSMPLFTGGKIGGGIDLAESGVEYSRAVDGLETDRIYYLTRIAWLSLAKAERVLDAARASYERTGIILDGILSVYQAGAADSVDILDAGLARTKAEDLVRQALTARRAAEIQLRTITGLEDGEDISLPGDLPEPDPSIAVMEIPESKPELLASRAAIELKRSQIKIVRAEYFPDLYLYTGYSYGKPNLDHFNNTWNDYYTFGASLSWAFNIGGRTGRSVKSAELDLDSVRHEHEDLVEQLNQELAISREMLDDARERYLNTRKENSITESSYRLAAGRHLQGALSTNRLLEIETSLTESQSSLAAALADYHMALSRYYLASGSPDLMEGI